MSLIHFQIEYITYFGQNIKIEYTSSNDNHNDTKDLMLYTYDGKNWASNLLLDSDETIHYRYVCTAPLRTEQEAPGYHSLTGIEGIEQIHTRDQWREATDNENIFFKAAFRDVYFKRVKTKTKEKFEPHTNYIQFKLNAPDIPKEYVVGIAGNTEGLGKWAKPILMKFTKDFIWITSIPVAKQFFKAEYKYVLCRPSGEIISWEINKNRLSEFNFPTSNGNIYVIHDEKYRHQPNWWKAAGMAIPVFSLRSKQGFGIGEYSDLKLAIDFCNRSGLKILQTLPVNDSIANYTYKDSYPYAAISVYALNPLYINVASIAPFKKKKDTNAYNKDLKRLNSLEEIDLLEVESLKLKYLHILYQENGSEIFSGSSFKKFYSTNKEWLQYYAAFCYLRDKYGTSKFSEWPDHQVFNQEELKSLLKNKKEKIGFYYFCQYYADKQLKEVKKYGQENEVVLKGDLPIGIFRHSCDAWVAPDLYNMNQQAGAPPDDYAESGQNWGFPTYNWDTMSKNDFSWWQSRMRKLSEYFDALRIDHILGFFRIWQIPLHQISGTMGVFNPRIPLSRHELAGYGIHGNLDRYTQPYIRQYMLDEMFGEETAYVIDEFLEEIWEHAFILKNNVQTQKQINDTLKEDRYKNIQHLRTRLLHLPSEILLLKDPATAEDAFNPRITLHTTYSYKTLSDYDKNQINALYNHYFYERHNEYWKEQALWKLPSLLKATDMLICGEDLGMIPASVPEVMKQLNIIPLEIQRMPKGHDEFGIPSRYDYYSVCSPSCHDMSTIRGWWEGNAETRQRFWNNHWHRRGEAPVKAETEIVESINREHLDAPSILAIFPLQDLVGMDKDLRKSDAFSEQINDPSDDEQYWNFRIHIDLEDLIEATCLTDKIKMMVEQSGRK